MARASLELSITERVWIGDVSRKHPDATFHVRSAQFADGVGVALVEVTAPDPRTVLAAVDRRDPVHSVETFDSDGGRALAQIEAEQPILLEVLDRAGVPVEMPFEIADGRVEWSLTTTRARLSTLAEVLNDSGIEYVVEYVRDSAEVGRVLTDTQQRLVEAALERGYYDSPRRCTQEELANDLDMAKSTCSETLHRAEERIVKEFENGTTPVLAEPLQTA